MKLVLLRVCGRRPSVPRMGTEAAITRAAAVAEAITAPP